MYQRHNRTHIHPRGFLNVSEGNKVNNSHAHTRDPERERERKESSVYIFVVVWMSLSRPVERKRTCEHTGTAAILGSLGLQITGTNRSSQTVHLLWLLFSDDFHPAVTELLSFSFFHFIFLFFASIKTLLRTELRNKSCACSSNCSLSRRLSGSLLGLCWYCGA